MDSIRELLSEYIASEAKLIGPQAVNERISALNEMFLHGKNMETAKLAEVMTTAHFATYFADALSRAFFQQYKYQGAFWRDFTFADTAPDFRDVQRYRRSRPGTLHKRREKAEHKATNISITGIHYGVEEYSDEFDVSWRAIMNDDLGEIRQVPQSMADAARFFEDAFVSALYDNAVSQAALIALGVNYAGTGRLTEANLAVAINALRRRVDASGNPLDIRRVWLVIPPELEIQAQKILTSTLIPGSANNDNNVVPKFIIGYRIDPYIATAPPNVPWYLFVDPGEIRGVSVARLQGWTGPIIARQRSDMEVIGGTAPAPFLMGSFMTGDIQYMVSTIIGGWDSATWVGITDPQGVYYSSGTTP